MSTTFGLGRRRPEGSAADLAVTASRVALLALTVAFLGAALADLRLSMRVQALVYLVGMVGLNLPHGGYEHFANLRRRATEFRLRYVGGYLAMVAGFVGLFAVAPVAGLALALAVACAKGGGGDLHVMRVTTGTDHLRTRAQRLLAATVRGGAVMTVPIVAFPETFHTFSGIMVGLFQPGALGAAGLDFGATRLAVAGGYGTLLVAHLGLGFRRRTGSGSFRADAAETLLLVAYFAVVPVVVAVGLYFPLWYSTRQVARELSVPEITDGPDLLDAETTGGVALRAWGVLVAGAVATGAVAAAVWLLAPNPLGYAPLLYGAVAFWSVFISIVALPHVVVGAVLDRGRGIWHVP
jgi:Brp/Blh family beta-carotene 15,15'-monooxygenase